MKRVLLTKEIVDDQLYLFSNGELIYKKWLNTSQSRVFHENEGDTNQVVNKEENNKFIIEQLKKDGII